MSGIGLRFNIWIHDIKSDTILSSLWSQSLNFKTDSRITAETLRKADLPPGLSLANLPRAPEIELTQDMATVWGLPELIRSGEVRWGHDGTPVDRNALNTKFPLFTEGQRQILGLLHI